MLLFATGFAAWAVVGNEHIGTLGLRLANPPDAPSVALERLLAVLVLPAALTAVTAPVLLPPGPA